MTYWHGGGVITGGMVLPPQESGVSRSGDVGVHITTERTLAETYASTVDGAAWVYEVEPLSPPIPVPSLVGGQTVSYRCERARIIRRFTIPRVLREQYRVAVRLGAETVR